MDLGFKIWGWMNHPWNVGMSPYRTHFWRVLKSSSDYFMATMASMVGNKWD